MVPPAGDPAVEPVKEEGRRRQGRGGKEMGRRLAAHVAHAQQDGRDPAGAVGQREEVRQVKLADHREVFARSPCHCKATYAGDRQMSRMLLQALKPIRRDLDAGSVISSRMASKTIRNWPSYFFSKSLRRLASVLFAPIISRS